MPYRAMYVQIYNNSKIFTPALVTILLFSYALFGLTLPTLQQSLTEQKKKKISDLTQTAISILQHHNLRSQQGIVSPEQARHQAKEQLRALRYGPQTKGYFWVNDVQPTMIMHPYQPELEGKSILNHMDSTGKLVFKEVVQQATSNSGRGGFVPYFWQWNDLPGRQSAKLSHVRHFPPWGWVVGTGLYLEDVEAEIKAISHKVSLAYLAILATVSILLTFIIKKNISEYTRRQATERALLQHQHDLEKQVKQRTKSLNRANRWLSQERQQLFSILENIPGFIYLQATDNTVVYTNAFFIKQFGSSKGKKCSELFQGTDNPCEPCLTDKVFETLEPQRWEWTQASNGEVYQVLAYPYWDTNQELYALVLGIDISERKRHEKEREELILNLQNALSEIKSLRDILPICSFCKKIRNDQGYYEQLEKYLHKHSGVDFSHTICPSCLEKHYPDEFKPVKGKTRT